MSSESLAHEERINSTKNDMLLSGITSVQECEELAYQLLASLPRSRLATIQRRLAPLLHFDVVGLLPTEIALQILSNLPSQTLITSALVNRRWHTLTNDQSLWRHLCHTRNWYWRHPPKLMIEGSSPTTVPESWEDSDDEGMGDSDEEGSTMTPMDIVKADLTNMQAEMDSGFISMSMQGPINLTSSTSSSNRSTVFFPNPRRRISEQSRRGARHSAPSVLSGLGPLPYNKPDYKLLYQTHIRLQRRFLTSNFRMSPLQSRRTSTEGHTNTIYCLQLYTYPNGHRVLFTGSRDKTVREWNLATGLVDRVISGVHISSVLSICVRDGYVASAGSDKRVAVWDLTENKLVKILYDHEESVLCVRFDEHRLVSCSKDRTVRTYSFPDLVPQFVLGAHRSAVNAVSIAQNLIVSASGDRSVRLWDAITGKLLRTFDNHHSRGIASIDFRPPFVLSGSSDKHLRLFDITTLQGWSTAPEEQEDNRTPNGNAPLPFSFPSNTSLTSTSVPTNGLVCQDCGSGNVGASVERAPEKRAIHKDLVRSVAFGEEIVVSGSYDSSIKVWDRKTGALIADLNGGHTGRIFCVGFDATKIVSCGEDMRICIWDFSHGIDTSFLRLA